MCGKTMLKHEYFVWKKVISFFTKPLWSYIVIALIEISTSYNSLIGG